MSSITFKTADARDKETGIAVSITMAVPPITIGMTADFKQLMDDAEGQAEFLLGQCLRIYQRAMAVKHGGMQASFIQPESAIKKQEEAIREVIEERPYLPKTGESHA